MGRTHWPALIALGTYWGFFLAIALYQVFWAIGMPTNRTVVNVLMMSLMCWIGYASYKGGLLAASVCAGLGTVVLIATLLPFVTTNSWQSYPILDVVLNVLGSVAMTYLGIHGIAVWKRAHKARAA